MVVDPAGLDLPGDVGVLEMTGLIRTSPGGKFTVDEKVPVTAGVHHIGLHHLALKVESEDALSKVCENYRRPVLRSSFLPSRCAMAWRGI